ncbi:MAG TPA: M81 family metallopeptidase [Burkholderiales bacterium]|nr:M81 family metallopeptidase [Burkholderiales bacterium]
MKLVIAQMQHETNTFSPVATPWEAFGNNGPLLGEAAGQAVHGTNFAMAAFLDLAREAGAQVVTPVAAWANPSGPVDGAAYDRICGAICEAVAQGCDAVLLDLHGAMVVADRTDDGEGTLLEKVRALAPRTPIAVSLDLHANVTERMVRNCDVITGYKTYPHVDQYQSGELAGSLLLRMMRGEIKPVMAWGNAPVLAQTLRQNTAEGAMKDFVEAARAAERNGLLAATAFGGFQMADIHDAGLSVVTVSDANRAAAETACNAILDVAWAQKEDFIYRGQPLQEAIAQARRMGEQSGGPILLLDHADNCASGSTQDTMYVLKEAMRQGLSGIAVAPIRDPEAVGKMINAGIGARVTLAVGGKMDMPSIRRKGEPLTLTGVIRAITDGEYTITGPQFTGMRCFMGKTAVLDTGVAQIIVSERNQEPWDRGVYESVGIDPARQRYLLLKSRMYFRPVFLPIAKGMVFCDAPGVSSSDWTEFEYRKLRRPIYPLDEHFANGRNAMAA